MQKGKYQVTVEGEVRVGKDVPPVPAGNLIVFSGSGKEIELSGEGRVIVLAGRPLYEPIAWYGPIVMNTEE